MEQLISTPDDALQRAAVTLESFGKYWEKLEGDKNGRHGLVTPIVERVHVDAELKMTLDPNHHLVSGPNASTDTEYTGGPIIIVRVLLRPE